MADQFETVSCVLCNEANAEVVVRGQGPAQYVRCRNDGLLYMNPRPRRDCVRQFHAQFVRHDNLELFDGFRRKTLEREARAVKKIKPGGNLLDVGCATGTFFENFEDGNWRLYGVDSSPLGVEIACNRHHAEVSCGTLAEAQYRQDFFDVVTVLDTLYYSPDPRSELTEIHRILKDDGLLALEIPGLTYSLLRERGPLCYLLDRRWAKGFTDSRHLYYFGPSTIKRLLESTGFRVVQMIPEQASLARRGLSRLLNDTHFLLAQWLFKLTAGRASWAGKELYLAAKARSRFAL